MFKEKWHEQDVCLAYSRGLRVLSEGTNIQMNSRMPHILGWKEMERGAVESF